MSWLDDAVSSSGADVRVGDIELWKVGAIVIAVLSAIVVGRVLAWLVLRVGERLAGRTSATWDDELVRALRGPLRILLASLLAGPILAPLALDGDASTALERCIRTALIASLAWIALRLVGVASALLERRAAAASDGGPHGELRLRGLRTQVLVLRRVLNVLLVVLAGALMLVQFDVVRSVGLSVLASAGMAGIVVGLAAQRSIATLLAGIQLSITQPIRIGDTVIVEGEWGTIEEINLTYVVLKVWDERRLVIPMSRFLDSAFQNWTRASSELLGTVFFHADYRLPVDEVRAELARFVERDPRWDRRAQGVVVTDAKERTIEVRALISAKDASDQWDLRCAVREHLVRWLRQHEGGEYLPRVRVEGDRERSGEVAVAE